MSAPVETRAGNTYPGGPATVNGTTVHPAYTDYVLQGFDPDAMDRCLPGCDGPRDEAYHSCRTTTDVGSVPLGWSDDQLRVTGVSTIESGRRYAEVQLALATNSTPDHETAMYVNPEQARELAALLLAAARAAEEVAAR